MKKNMRSIQGTLVSRQQQKALKGGWNYIAVCHNTGEVFASVSACRKSGRCDGSCGLECTNCP